MTSVFLWAARYPRGCRDTSVRERRTYRVKPFRNYKLCLLIETIADRAEGELIEVSVKGAAARVRLEDLPLLRVGDRVWLVFESGMIPAPIAVQATVRNLVTEAQLTRYGFEFEEPWELEGRISQRLHELFNRRRAYRVEPVEPVEVRLIDSKRFETTSLLKCISATGLCVLVKPETAPRFEVGKQLEVSFDLSQQVKGFKFVVWSRNRQLHNGKTSYGLEFDPVRSEAFKRQQEAIYDYITEVRSIGTPRDLAG